MRYPIYLDYAATTPCEKQIIAEMIPYFTEHFGNASSLHKYGQVAHDALDDAREKVRKLINAEFNEIIFTSGATESNRISIERPVQKLAKSGKNHFITLKTEHKSVLDDANYLKSLNYDVTLLDVKNDGLLDINELTRNIKDNTALISVCFVNNETGVLQNIKEIVEVCHQNNVLVHTDATQALGKISIDVKDLNVDFLSASGHKIYGPKGIGVLFCKKQYQKLLKVPGANPEVEFGIRSGTVPIELCVGIGKACQMAYDELEGNLKKISKLRKMFTEGITSQLEEIYINGSNSNYPGIINMSFRGCEGEAIMMEASRIAVSSGSACTSNKLSISHVLEAMNIKSDIAQSSIRISIGKHTTEEDIKIAIEDLVTATNKLRKMSPIWDMIKSGIDIDSVFQNGENHEI